MSYVTLFCVLCWAFGAGIWAAMGILAGGFHYSYAISVLFLVVAVMHGLS